MGNLRGMIDGIGSLGINAEPVQADKSLRVQQDVVIRRATSRTGPATKEVIVGRIMSMGSNTAVVAVNQAGGRTVKKEVRLTDISPVTQQFKLASIQFRPDFRGQL